MLTVIVEAGEGGERLPGVLAVLTTAAVEGLVREVVIAGGGPAELLGVLREETGAELAAGLGEAIAAARSDLLLAMGDGFRPKAQWTEALVRHLRSGGRDAVVEGEGGGFLKKAAYAVLIPAAKARGLAHPDLKKLRAQLDRSAARLG